ncbi:hypothetical protein EZV73_07570 [Acidaminobacter sp. JC074]|uniref:hypothetical protein n=1 Tax=Acidaminobacter sp. JC074 TaxID=2530199 RepID=UPI001F110CDC|nr:hypothetical protein [Acidaminobacter sp. JC074]MCH4887424.1 hypothetical protein [Acidaminobacter sp. JC074]
MRQASIMKATKLELYMNLLLGLIVLILAKRLDAILLYAQASSAFIGGAIAYSNLRFIRKNQSLTDKEKRLINGRKEYFFNISLSIVLVYFGIVFFREGLHLGHETHLDHISLLIISLVSFIKYYVGSMTIKEANELESTSLRIIGLITRNEAFMGMVNVISLSGILTKTNASKISIIIMSLIMILTGLRTISYHKKVLIGLGLDEQTKKRIYTLFEQSPYIDHIDDLVLNDYGYKNKILTLNTYVNDDLNIKLFCQALDEIKAQIQAVYDIEVITNMIILK